MENLIPFLAGLISLAIGSVLGYFARQTIAKKQLGTVESKLSKLILDAKQKVKDLELAARDKAVKILQEAKDEERQIRNQIIKQQELLNRREENLEKKIEVFNRDEKDLQHKITKVKEIKKELGSILKKEGTELQKIAKLSEKEAKERLFKQVEEKYSDDLADSIQKLEKNKREELEKKAFDIMTGVVHRYARTHVADVTTSVVSIPNDDLKGRIIGKEGRNIKTLERLTGVEIIVDDTPEAITISGFSPIRREVAKMTLEKLMVDGRIQPARIEEKFLEAQEEMKKRITEAGEAACQEVGIVDLPPQLVHLLGRLAFRTSYGQNVLVHSIEATHIASMLACELGANVDITKKGALLHDIGKAVDHEIEGTHIEIGRKILEKYGIKEDVIKAMQSHHEDYPYETAESFIVTAAEAVSAARPGARKDTLENYIKRLEELEKIANSFEGIEKSYAIQAGREIRIFVTPEKVDDMKALALARDIASRIEADLKYPGEIKVNVIRETRSIEYAR